MTYSLNSSNVFPSGKSALRAGVIRFSHEVGLLLGLVLLGLWTMALWSYSPQDPAWSTSGAMEPSGIRNWLGRPGAWLADATYFSLGFSVWWCFAVAARVWLASLLRYLTHGKQRRQSEAEESLQQVLQQRALWLLGLALLLCASTGLEWTRLYQLEARLPGHAGGMLGYVIGPTAMKWLGFTASGVVGIVLTWLGAALVFRFSWSSLAENLGARIDGLVRLGQFRREVAQDMAQGKRAAREREEVVEHERSDHKAFPWKPLQIIDPALDAEPEQSTNAPVAPPSFAATLAAVDGDALAATSTSAARSAQNAAHDSAQRERLARLPRLELLDAPMRQQEPVAAETLEMTSRLIEKKLRDFGVEVRVMAAMPGPVVTRYELQPSPGFDGGQIAQLARDLARSLSLVSIRVIESLPGSQYVGLELPNAKRHTIRLVEVLAAPAFRDAESVMTLGLGKDITGNPVVADLAKMPHLLVAGTTGAGKSVGLHAMILSILYKAAVDEVRLLMIDPKMLELAAYEGIPHLLAPVVTDMRYATNSLHWCVAEMERRYKLMARLGVRQLSGYNAKIDEVAALDECIYDPFSPNPEAPTPLERLPHIVIVIDELADLMLVDGKKHEELIARLAQKARGAGIHLILATQRPSAEVVTGLIKANIPTRIAFQVSSKTDSRTILDQTGAEVLLGTGDMLYMASGTGVPVRVHGAYVGDAEVQRVVSYLRGCGRPDYVEGVLQGQLVQPAAPAAPPAYAEDEGDDQGATTEDITLDPMYELAVQAVMQGRQANPAHLQRQLRISYNRAAHLLEDMEYAGLVGPANHTGQREILL